jgi:hypothetical protein
MGTSSQGRLFIHLLHSKIEIGLSGKAVPLNTMDAQGERRYSSYSFMTSALDGGDWSAYNPGHTLFPGKGRHVPAVQEAGWTPEPVWTQRSVEQTP